MLSDLHHSSQKLLPRDSSELIELEQLSKVKSVASQLGIRLKKCKSRGDLSPYCGIYGEFPWKSQAQIKKIAEDSESCRIGCVSALLNLLLTKTLLRNK